MPHVLGKEEGFILPVRGWEKWLEILHKILEDGAGKFYPWVKEKLDIPVKDAIGAAKLETAVAKLWCGPEQENEYPEATPERVILRVTKCAWWERYNVLKLDPELRGGCDTCKVWCEEGLKAVNPKITRKYTKTIQRGDPYCKAIIEFKEE